RRVVRERSQCEGVLIGILALVQQFENEIPAAHVMHQVAEFLAPKWIIAKILDDRASIGIGVCVLDLIRGKIWEALQQQRLNLGGPRQVDDLLVRKNGVRKRGSAQKQCDQSRSRRPRQNKMPSFFHTSARRDQIRPISSSTTTTTRTSPNPPVGKYPQFL